MIHRFIGTSTKLVQQLASQPVTLQSAAKAARGVMTTAKHTLTVFGLSALAMLAVLYARPDLARHLSGMMNPAANAPQGAALVVADPKPALAAPAAPVVAAAAPALHDTKALASSKQQQFVTSWLSKRYRVAGDAANMLVSTTYSTARDIKLDPLLILAVMAIESGLNPFAESPVGAKGLMQVMAKVHHDRFAQLGGTAAALNPAANIRVGAEILKDYMTRSGSVEGGLKSYVGAGAFDSDSGYGSRVLAEYRRLKQVATGQKVPTITPPAPVQTLVAKTAPAPAAPNADTAAAPAPAPAEHPADALANL